MPLNFAMSLMSAAEFLLWAILGFVFWKKDLHRRFPAMSTYLALRVGSMPVLVGLLYVQAQPWGSKYFPLYFYAYWAVYIASAITLFFICMEVFRSVLSAFSGLMRLGTVVFRWAALASLIVSLTSIHAHHGVMVIPDIAFGLMRSVSILELCLLAFLCLSMNALNSSVRDIAFGIALGFGVLSASDFVVGSLLSRSTSLTSPLQFVSESLTLLTLGVWVAYCAMPEPARKLTKKDAAIVRPACGWFTPSILDIGHGANIRQRHDWIRGRFNVHKLRLRLDSTPNCLNI